MATCKLRPGGFLTEGSIPPLLFPISATHSFPVQSRFQLSNISLRLGKLHSIKMRDRSKNRRPLQRGRFLSIEAIQVVQSLKRAKINGRDSLDHAVETKVRRLIKRDMVSVLKELISQNECMLAFLIFEEVRKEHWYKPQLSLYVEMIKVLANHGLYEKVEHICSYLKRERLEPDTDGFDLLLETLLEFRFSHIAMDCFRLMKMWESEPDQSTFRILINGLESNGEKDLSVAMRQEAEKYFDGHLAFLEEEEMETEV